MKKYLLLGVGALAVTFAACTNEDYVSQSSRDCLLSATVEGNTPSTRVGFDLSGSFYWNTDDEVGITTINNESEGKSLSKLILSEGAGTGSGSFNGSIIGTIGNYAVYPYNEDDQVLSGTLTYHYKSSYTEKLETSKAGTAGDTETNASRQSFNPAMAGVISNNKVTFKHLGGVLVVQIPDLPITAGKLTVKETNGYKINGAFTATLSDSNDPTVTSVATETDSEKVTEVNFTGAEQNQNAIFYVPLPVAPDGGYEFRIKLLDSNDKEYVNVVSPAIKLARRDLYLVAISNVVITGTSEANTVSTASAASDALGTSTSVSVESVTSENATITVPSISDSSNSSDEPTSRNVIVQDIADNTTLTVTDANTTDSSTAGDASNSVKELNLSLPATDSKIVKLDVTMANTSVTVESNTGSGTTIAEANVSTSENTFVIGSGVTITTLNVKKGSVRVKSGATVSTIKNETGGTVNLIIESGATVTTKDGTFNESITGAENDLRKAAAIGGTVTLSENVTISEAIVVAGNVTIDLNGHTIAPTATTLNQSHDPFTGSKLNSKDGILVVRRGGKLTIKDSKGKGYVTTGESDNILCTIKVTDSNDYTYDSTDKKYIANSKADPVITIESGILKSKHYAISGNGNRSGTEVNIKGGQLISSSGYALYHPEDGTLNISGGAVEGGSGALAIQRGTLNISAGTLTSKGTAEVTVPATGDGTWGLYNAALTISGRYGVVNATITGGEFIAEGTSTAVSVLHNNASTNYAKNVTVSGAKFSDLSPLAGLSDTYSISGSFTLSKSVTTDSLKVVGNKNVTVDLNGNTVTVNQMITSEIALNDGKTLGFKNGTITIANRNTGAWAINVDKGGIVLDKVTLDASGWHTALGCQGQFSKADIINGSSVTGLYFGLSTNASVSSDGLVYGRDAVITLKDSKFNSPETGFMNNVPATVNIDNCEFSGNHQGALLRGGTYTIKDSKFTLNATLPTTDSECKNSAVWGDGNRAAYAPIVIGNRSAVGYYAYPTTVAFEGSNKAVLSGTYATSFPAMFVWGNTSEYKATLTTASGSDLSGFNIVDGNDIVLGGYYDISGATIGGCTLDESNKAN